MQYINNIYRNAWCRKGCEEIQFLSNEKWKKVPYEDLKFTYYVSNAGRVMVYNNYGLFKIIKQSICSRTGQLLVSLLTNKKRKGTDKYDSISLLVARLVIQTFIGGYFPRRKFTYLNGDKMNCHIKNLRWSYGFPNGVDYTYLLKLDDTKVADDLLLIKNYLLTKNDAILYELICKKEFYFKKIFRKEANSVDFFEDWKADIFFVLKSATDKGFILPAHNTSVTCKDTVLGLLASHCRWYVRRNLWQRLKQRSFDDNTNSTRNYSSVVYDDVIPDGCLGISEEIEAMFSNFS